MKKIVDNVVVENLKIETSTKKVSVQGCLKEAAAAAAGISKSKKKLETKATTTILEVHTIRAEFHEVVGEITAVQCAECDRTKGKPLGDILNSFRASFFCFA